MVDTLLLDGYFRDLPCPGTARSGRGFLLAHTRTAALPSGATAAVCSNTRSIPHGVRNAIAYRTAL